MGLVILWKAASRYFNLFCRVSKNCRYSDDSKNEMVFCERESLQNGTTR